MRHNKINNILTKWYFQLGILLVTLFLFLIFRNVNEIYAAIFGFLVGLELIIMVIFEIKYGAKKHGWKHELYDTLIALVVALFIWYLASFLLNTSSPLSAVASCSMLSNLQRGDFVVVQGSKINAHEITMSEAEFNALKGDTVVYYNGKQALVKGSIYSYCNAFSGDPVCIGFFTAPEQFIEKKGPLTFHYSKCELFTDSGTKYTPCVSSVDHAGKNYKQSFDNDILVYTPTKGDIFSAIGDIVHRSYFKITTDAGNVYYLSKGDNNPVFDIQFYDYNYYKAGNNPVSSNNVKGKVLTRIPYLGYFKLLITPAVDHEGKLTSLGVMDIEQCRTQLKLQ